MASIGKQMLGTQTVRELRARGVQTKICGCSANNLVDEFFAAGADFFVLKPFPCEKNELRRELTCLWNASRRANTYSA